jgi:hypothetical protein
MSALFVASTASESRATKRNAATPQLKAPSFDAPEQLTVAHDATLSDKRKPPRKAAGPTKDEF